jgi:hypothetical protein
MTDTPFDIIKLRQLLLSFAAESEQASLQREPATRAEYRELVDRYVTKLQVMAVGAAMPMDEARWLNCWKILRSIDYFELREIMSPSAWERWRTNPPAWLAIQNDATQAKVWAIVIARGG